MDLVDNSSGLFVCLFTPFNIPKTQLQNGNIQKKITVIIMTKGKRKHKNITEIKDKQSK